MKLNMGKPIVAVLIPAFIGIISCSDNPIKSAGENAESGRSESAGEHRGNTNGEGHEGREGSEGSEGSEGGAGRLVANQGGDGGGEGGENHSGREGSEGSEGSDGSDAGGEGQPLAPDQSYDQTRNGARLIMWYVPSKDEFYGTVENTTNQTLTRVRVEIHLSDESGAIIAELGPTWPQSLTPGEKLYLSLPVGGQVFAGWSPMRRSALAKAAANTPVVKAAVKAAVKAGGARVMRPAAMPKAPKAAEAIHRARSSPSTSRLTASSTACAWPCPMTRSGARSRASSRTRWH